MNLLKKILNRKKELLIISLLLLIAGISHGYNMFHFPYFENDEGTYSSYAWSLLTEGKLSPYTYWYDHAPAGWILIALWVFLTGGFFTFGFSLNSGRILMLIIHLLSSLLLYYIGKRLTKSKWVGGLSVILFSLSPLGIYFQRRILLDNIMTFWILLSLTFLLYYRNKLRNIIASAITFGIAVLSKENAIFWIPAFLYIIHIESHGKHKSFALVKWLTIMGLVVILYFLYALFKGELFPSGTFLGGTHEHVSLLGTLQEQFQRGGGGIFDVSKSAFWNNVSIWLEADPVILVAGAVATVMTLLLGIKDKFARIVGLLSASMWAFLMRGGLVIEFYILPLLPFLALSISYCVWFVHQKIHFSTVNKFTKSIQFLPYILVIAGFTISSLYYSTNIRNTLNLYTSDQTTPQVEAVDWILSQKTKRFYVIDDYALIDLRVKNTNNFKHAEYYWKVDRDPAISKTLLGDNPQDIDFIALTPQMEHDILAAGLDITRAAWHNSKPIERFWNDGWGVEFWATNYPTRILESSWESYRRDFIINGRVIDPYQNNDTTSEGQSYALLRAAWMHDRETFDSVFLWTKTHLQQPTNLFSWKWQGTDSEGRTLDSGTATDADQDIALALLFAYKQWGNEAYLRDAKQIIAAIWKYEVAIINGDPYITAANWADHGDTVTFNPSYISPAHYRIFADVDKSHPWKKVADTSYFILQGCTKAKLDKDEGLLPPEWCSLDKKGMVFQQPGIHQPRATEYSYNAFRTPWRVALDYKWNNEPKARAYLTSLNKLADEYIKKGKVATAYQHNGIVWEDYESAAAYGGNIGYFMVVRPDKVALLYKEKLVNKFYEDKERSFWDDPKNYYTQNWAWFGTALYTDNVPNLWELNK